ncbi:MAG: hypothetical protein WAX04_09845 [Oscillospiraceae bacterium]
MKNKILASLLAVCLFVGMAVPAFASATSAQSGDASDVTLATFAKAEYTIAKDDSKNFTDEVKAFVSKSKLVLDANLSFELADNNAGVFAIDGAVVSAVEKTGTATLIVKNIDDKKVGSVKIKAGAAIPQRDATGYRFIEKTNNVPVESIANNAAATTAANNFTIKVAPTPAGSDFLATDVALINDAIEAAIIKALGTTNDVSMTAESKTKIDAGKNLDDDGNLVYVIDGKTLLAGSIADQKLDADLKNVEVPVTFTSGKVITSKTTIKAVLGKVAIGVSAPSTIKIEVGQVFKLGDKAKHVASDSNINNGISYDEDYLNDDATDYDFAIVDGDGKVTGVAVGKNKIVSTMTYVNKDGKSVTKTAVTIVEVVAAGSISTAKPSLNPTAKMIVGGTHKIAVKDAGTAALTFSSYDAKVATVAADGTIKAIGVGTTKVKVAVAGSDSLYVTVTVAAAPAVVNPTKPTDVPKTGV